MLCDVVRENPDIRASVFTIEPLSADVTVLSPIITYLALSLCYNTRNSVFSH